MIRTYIGSCHCGRTRFEVDMDLDHVRACDCSICRRRGALIHRVPEEALRILTPLADLVLYQWHTFTASDYLCPVCGILPFRRPRMQTTAETRAGMPPFTGWAVNVRCLDGVELDAIPVRRVHGSRLP
ncbi:MAG TPA: GFA family protein [Candidatus Dormibacteraeota bacterium]|nr:GFA family protein [Candidatus Dormibacteraeota bacterium]